MTEAEVLGMPAGRELNALVAEKVMGQAWQGGNPVPNYDGRWPWPPPYSTDIAAAFEVAEAVSKLAWHLSRGSRGYNCQIVLAECLTKCFEVRDVETAPLAICRAALLTVKGTG
jgi:hypothetical protein